MRFLRNSLTGLFLASLTLGLLAYAGQTIFSAVQERMSDETEMPERRERVFAVNVTRGEPQTITPELTTFGEVQSRRNLEIRAKTSGTIIELASVFQDGGEVDAGQVLARIDPADAQSALDRARSDLADAEAEVREAERGVVLARDDLTAAREQAALRERAFTRQKDLEDRGVGTASLVETAELAAAQARQAVLNSRQALAQAEARVDQAATGLTRAQIALSEAERRLEDTIITAGFSGTLAEVSIVAGGIVAANEKLALLIDAEALEVAFRVSTAQYARLLDDQGRLLRAPLRVALDTMGTDLGTTGVLTRTSGAVGEGQTGRLLFARLDSASGLKPGDFVTVRIEEPPLEEVVRLPASALGADGRVLIVTEESRLLAVPVTLLRRQGDDILVRGDAIIGQDVVRERSPLLGEGIRVRLLDPEEDPQEEAHLMLNLNEDRRASLIAFVQADSALTETDRARMIALLSQSRVPEDVVRQLETRMGG